MPKNNFMNNFMLPPNLMNTSKDNVPNITFGGVSLPEKTIYIDFASSTPLDIRVFEKLSNNEIAVATMLECSVAQ